MSLVNGIIAEEFVEKNHPENGIFQVYWMHLTPDKLPDGLLSRYKTKKLNTGRTGGGTFDSNKSEGLRWEWYYKDGKRADGISKGWFRDGTLRHVMHWKDNMENGLEVEYYENGNPHLVGMYRNGRLYGKWLTFSPDGSQYSVFIYNEFGRKSGILKEWYSNNKLRLIERWKNGQQHGKYIHFNEKDGINRIVTWKNGKREGLSKSWSPDGRDSAQWICKNNSPYTGHKIIWWQSGERKLDEIYKNGERICQL